MDQWKYWSLLVFVLSGASGACDAGHKKVKPSPHGLCGQIHIENRVLQQDFQFQESKSAGLTVCFRDTKRPLHAGVMFDPRPNPGERIDLSKDDRSFEHTALNLKNQKLKLGCDCTWSLETTEKNDKCHEFDEIFKFDEAFHFEGSKCKGMRFLPLVHSPESMEKFQKQASSFQPSFQQHGRVKKIWTFWDKGMEKAPQLEKNNVKLWQALHPDWDVTVIDTQEGSPHYVFNYIEPAVLPQTFLLMHPVLQSDFVRLAVLEKFGGIWLDSGVFTTRNLSAEFSPHVLSHGDDQFDLVGFVDHTQTDLKFFQGKQHFESFTLASNPGSPVIKSWYETMKYLFEYRFSTFDIFSYKELEKNPQTIEKDLSIPWFASRDYLAIYLLLRKTLEDNPSLMRHFLKHTKFYNVNEDGAFWFMNYAHWSEPEMRMRLFSGLDQDYYEQFMKRSTHKFINQWGKLANKIMGEMKDDFYLKTTLGQAYSRLMLLTAMESKDPKNAELKKQFRQKLNISLDEHASDYPEKLKERILNQPLNNEVANQLKHDHL